MPIPSLRARERNTGLPHSTAHRLIKEADAKRAKLTAHEEGVSWSQVKARKGHSKITEAVRAALHDWVLNHPRVVNCPIAKETLLVRDEETKDLVRVGKLLLEITVRELHNDLIELPVEQGGSGGGLAEARDDKGKIIISDTSLRYLLPPQLKPMRATARPGKRCATCSRTASRSSSKPKTESGEPSAIGRPP